MEPLGLVVTSIFYVKTCFDLWNTFLIILAAVRSGRFVSGVWWQQERRICRQARFVSDGGPSSSGDDDNGNFLLRENHDSMLKSQSINSSVWKNIFSLLAHNVTNNNTTAAEKGQMLSVYLLSLSLLSLSVLLELKIGWCIKQVQHKTNSNAQMMTQKGATCQTQMRPQFFQLICPCEIQTLTDDEKNILKLNNKKLSERQISACYQFRLRSVRKGASRVGVCPWKHQNHQNQKISHIILMYCDEQLKKPKRERFVCFSLSRHHRRFSWVHKHSKDLVLDFPIEGWMESR